MISRVVKDKAVLKNILMMILVWTSASFTFYLFNFLIKYMPGDLYYNSVVSGLAAAAMLTQGII